MSLSLNNKQPVRRKPSGLSQAEADRIEAEFTQLIAPFGQKATQFFRGFNTAAGSPRWWLLPHAELWSDLPIEKQQFVLRYKTWFVSEISRVVLDDVHYDSNPAN